MVLALVIMSLVSIGSLLFGFSERRARNIAQEESDRLFWIGQLKLFDKCEEIERLKNEQWNPEKQSGYELALSELYRVRQELGNCAQEITHVVVINDQERRLP